MKKSFVAALALLGGLCASVVSAQVKGVYWTTSGYFGPFPIVALIPGLPKEKQRDVKIPVSMFIIDHPKGLVVFDTGPNVAVADGMDNCKKYWPAIYCELLRPTQTRADLIDMQLQKLGYSVDKVKVVVTSHTHGDHVGNIKMFPNAIHVMQKKELYQGWWPEKFQGRDGTGSVAAFVMGDLAGAREFNYLELEGDYDLFGDGSVMILSTPGHTLGHQSMKVKLPSGKTIVMAQDAIWRAENLEGYLGNMNYSSNDFMKSVDRLKFIRDLEDADLLMSHDDVQYKAKGGGWLK